MTLLDRVTPEPISGQISGQISGPISDPISRSTDWVHETEWVDVCALDDLTPDRGVCALVGQEPVAVFYCSPDRTVYALGNVDPFSQASVMSRGIVGCAEDRAFVASPIYKNRFDLHTGQSLDDPKVGLPVYATDIVGNRVLVAKP